jgi:hypothetical protein
MIEILREYLPLKIRKFIRSLSNKFTWPHYLWAGYDYGKKWQAAINSGPMKDGHAGENVQSNPLWDYFIGNKQGLGIWKWNHYFPIYHRYFSRFVDQPVKVLEIGVYSGGSLAMWRSYFGADCQVFGVDIEPACRAYATENTIIEIGDQADRDFWRRFFAEHGPIDIIIDDGGHKPRQQRITLEEVLPHINPGGIYFCEDIHGAQHAFTGFAAGLVSALNGSHQSGITPLQSEISAIHFYPFALVIEKHTHPLSELSAPRMGADWESFPLR